MIRSGDCGIAIGVIDKQVTDDDRTTRGIEGARSAADDFEGCSGDRGELILAGRQLGTRGVAEPAWHECWNEGVDAPERD